MTWKKVKKEIISPVLKNQRHQLKKKSFALINVIQIFNYITRRKAVTYFLVKMWNSLYQDTG